jgi:hypothetical protein
MTRVFRSALVLAAAAAFMPRAVSATPVYFIDVSRVATGSPNERFEQSSSAAVSHGLEYFSGVDLFGNFIRNTAFAGAEAGQLRASAHAETFLPDIQDGLLAMVINTASATAGFRLDDIIITGPDSTVDTSINLSLDGGVSATANAAGGGAFGFEATANGMVTVSGQFGPRFAASQSRGAVCDAQTLLCDSSFFEDEFLTGFGGAGIITTPAVTVSVGVPLGLALQLVVAGNGNSTNGGFGNRRTAEGSASFGSTLSFALSGPVFNLPAGYTANSVSGLIVDNHWVRASDTPTAVPEPGTFSLLGLGVLALARRFGRGKVA